MGRGRRARDGRRGPLRRRACRSTPGSTWSPTANGGGAPTSASSPSSRTASRWRSIPPTAGRGRWSPRSSRRSRRASSPREAKFLKKRRARRHQDHAARPGAARRAAVGRRALAQGLSEARRLRARLRGAAAPRDRAAAATSASTSCRSTIRICACSSIPTCARSYDDPDRAADFAVDMINALVDGLHRHQVRGASLPPRRRARARREAPCRHLRADPAAAQPPERAAPHDGVHRRRRRRPREPRPPARGFRAGPRRGRRDAGRAAERAERSSRASSARCSASTRSASRSIPTAASPPARPPRSISTRSISSCAPRPSGPPAARELLAADLAAVVLRDRDHRAARRQVGPEVRPARRGLVEGRAFARVLDRRGTASCRRA